MDINKTVLKKVASSFATGVTIITAKESADKLIGMTASSFVSVSLDPPLVSFFVDNNAKLLDNIKTGDTIGISILSSDQQNISNHFAGYPDPEKAVEFDQSEGFPVVKSALAWYIIKVTQLTPTGDHQMVLCAVEKLGRNEDLSPLLYYSGKYL
tara:strand:- start:1001 stop:1462 length:462 start_codon:yes stop_codon:yes gene_type:complete